MPFLEDTFRLLAKTARSFTDDGVKATGLKIYQFVLYQARERWPHRKGPKTAPHQDILILPLQTRPGKAAPPRSCAIIHAFYVDRIEELLGRLSAHPFPIDVYVSTDTQDKQALISSIASSYENGHFECRVCANRGRDIAPKFVLFRDVYPRYELFLHFHMKKSLHGGAAVEKWFDYLFDALLGHTDVIEDVYSILMSDMDVGIVFPEHYQHIKTAVIWGLELDRASALMRRAGHRIDTKVPVEFPSGSMFWGRTAAIMPLLSLNLNLDDFEPEGGQVENTTAHAIERLILHSCESVGLRWISYQCIKASAGTRYIHADTLLDVKAALPCLHYRLLERKAL
jgi:lipopolysaccharide biosynthesis protein